MDIYTAINASTKLSNYTTDLTNSKSRLYQNTTQKLERIKTMLSGCIENIDTVILSKSGRVKNENTEIKFSDMTAEIMKFEQTVYQVKDSDVVLQDDSLDNIVQIATSCKSMYTMLEDFIKSRYPAIAYYMFGGEDEEKESGQEEIFADDIADAENNDNSMNSIIDSNADNEKTANITAEITEEPAEETAIEPAEEINSDNVKAEGKINTKEAFSIYAKTLTNLKHSGYMPADKCIDLLKDWFTKRFIDYKDGFYFKITKIPEWIRAIIACYATAYRENRLEKFIDDFYKWMQNEETMGKYALPYEVFQSINPDSDKYKNLTSAVLWDIISDTNFKGLYDTSNITKFPNYKFMYKWIFAAKPELILEYKNYKNRPEILSKCSIVKIDDTD